MSKRTLKPEIKETILECLEDGKKTTAEIKKAVSGGGRTIDTCLSELTKEGKVVRKKRGLYALPAAPAAVQDAPAGVENLRSKDENIATINRLLSLYDTLLDGVLVSIENEDWEAIDKKVQAINSLRSLASTINQLLKRYNLISQGYDTNTRQAVEDAKQKTVEREQHDLENAPPEAQVAVVMEYDESMREILAKMPKLMQEETTV